jgi:glutamate formiminotransferase
VSEPTAGVVPNFSEGRRLEVISEVVRALETPGARVVFAEADPDHNRLDTTVLGTIDACYSSAMAGALRAIELIDMTNHEGGHPRMGAADVIPFMPVRGVRMRECVDTARRFAKELAERAEIPVYLYGEAAIEPGRRSLADVRKGEYEGLRAAVAAGERLPDFGPNRLGRAGATAVGARKPLVAFNVYLRGEEAAAKEIARMVRESGGGLPAVRAIGFAVPERGCVTVSMNLVDSDVTPPRVAFDRVAELGAERGLSVIDSEIVGLVPGSALGDEDVSHLRLKGFDASKQVLERSLEEDRG